MVLHEYKIKNDGQDPGQDDNGDVVYPISFKENIESLIQTFTDREVYLLEKLIPDINELNADMIDVIKNLVKTVYENKNTGKSPGKDEDGNNFYSIKNRIWIKKEITDQIIANNPKSLNL
jgi:penicillin-binding protein-related factor A (putative recombinase)